MTEQDKEWGTECGRVVLCLVMRKGFSHRWFLNKDLKDALCGGRALPVEGTASANACRRVHWDVGLPYRQWKHGFADGPGNRKKRMPFIATLKNREGASGIRRKKRNDISKWRS